MKNLPKIIKLLSLSLFSFVIFCAFKISAYEMANIVSAGTESLPLVLFSIPEKEILNFYNDNSATTDLDGNIYISTRSYGINKYSSDGNYLFSFGNKGTGNGEFEFIPNDIAVDANGFIFVATRNKIQVFDRNGVFVRKIGSYGNEIGKYIAIKSIELSSNNNVIVGDDLRRKVLVYKSDGTFLTEFGKEGIGNGELISVKCMDVDSFGNIYISDGYVSYYRIQKFSADGLTYSTIIDTRTNDEARGYMYAGGGFVITKNNELVLQTGGIDSALKEFNLNGQFVRKILDSSQERVPLNLINKGNGSEVLTLSQSSLSKINIKDPLNYQKYVFPFDESVFSSIISSDGNIVVSTYRGISKFPIDFTKNKPKNLTNNVFQYSNASFYKGVAVDNNGNILVADAINKKILKFDKNGEKISEFSIADHMSSNFVRLIVNDDNSLSFLADYSINGYRVSKFSSDGSFLGSKIFPRSEVTYATDFSQDAFGNIFIIHASGGYKLTKFNADGQKLMNFGIEDGDGKLEWPRSLFIRNNKVYVVHGSKKLSIFNIDGTFLNSMDVGLISTVPNSIYVDQKENILLNNNYEFVFLGQAKTELIKEEGAPEIYEVVEGSGKTITYKVGLSSPISYPVTFDLIENSTDLNIQSSLINRLFAQSGSNYQVNPRNLIFTPSNWSIPQTVIVSAVDDNVLSGNKRITLSYLLSSKNNYYNGVTMQGIAFDLLDNDGLSTTGEVLTGGGILGILIIIIIIVRLFIKTLNKLKFKEKN